MMIGKTILPLECVTIFGIFRLGRSPRYSISDPFFHPVHCQVTQCYVGVLDVYANPNTLTMFDMSQVQTYKLIDCNKAHYPKEIIQ